MRATTPNGHHARSAAKVGADTYVRCKQRGRHAAAADGGPTRRPGEFARDAVQVFGGYGFMRELAADGSHYHVEEIYRDCKIAEIYEVANEIQKLVIARGIFGKGVTG